MKIEQILEGRAEEIDSQIAALRREKAALGRPNTPPPGTQVAALPNTPPPGTQPGTQVAAGTGADGPAGRYAPNQVAAGTGADGPAGQYATPTPEVDDFRSMTAAEKATAYRNKMHAIPDKQSQQILNTEKSKRQTAQSGAFDKLMKNAGLGGNIGGGTAKKGDDNWEWYNNPGTRMTPDAAKYADETGESPEIQKPQGNLLKWMKANATKRKAFDQDAANK